LLEHGFGIDGLIIDAGFRLGVLGRRLLWGSGGCGLLGAFLHPLLKFVLEDHLARLRVQLELGDALRHSFSHGDGSGLAIVGCNPRS
jgi:hypothetical protein